MLCFVFAALVVILDQLFKHWIVINFEEYEQMKLIPGIIGLTHVPNRGAAFSILSNQRLLLICISFLAAIVLIFFLLRYTEGFWGTLGLSAVLGGTVGNLIDRVFRGRVIDMFRPLFTEFAIFNVADIFLTLGFATFCIHFIVSFVKSSKNEEVLDEYIQGEEEDEAEDPYSMYDIPENRKIPVYDDLSETKVVPVRNNRQSAAAQPDYHAAAPKKPDPYEAPPEQTVYPQPGPERADYRQPEPGQPDYKQPEPGLPDDLSSALDALEALESELDSIESYDTDALLREYGFDGD